MSATRPKKTLTRLPLSSVSDNEYIAMELVGNGWYDTKQHPRMGARPNPVYQLHEGHWQLINAHNDELFAVGGAVRRQGDIAAFLTDTHGDVPFAEFDIVAFNVRAGEQALQPGIDYTADGGCQLPQAIIDGKTYFLVDGYTYMLSALLPDLDIEVDVVSFDGTRLPDIEAEEQREYDARLAKTVLHLAADCEAGQFITSIIVGDFLVLQYDVESSVYALKQASTTRLYLLYAADKLFLRDLSPIVLRYHTEFVTSTVLYSQLDNTTISISALLLELLYENGASHRREQRATLLQHNADALAAMNLLHTRTVNDDDQVRYIDINYEDYERQCNVFTAVFKRRPQADILQFVDND